LDLNSFFCYEVVMRGDEQLQEEMFSYGSLSDRVPLSHPLRRVRAMADEAMGCLETRFEQMYSRMGRPSVPPEQMLRALLLQMLYSVRSERMLVEQMEYNLLFRWFVGLGMNDRVWDATSFTKNRERLLSGDVAQVFFSAVVASARQLRLLSDEHFTVDGTLIEAWASEKSYQPKDGPPPAKGKGSGHGGSVLKSDTHASKTDPDARLYRKSLRQGLSSAAHGACGERERARAGGSHRSHNLLAVAGTGGRDPHDAPPQADHEAEDRGCRQGLP
jgi:transposase